MIHGCVFEKMNELAHEMLSELKSNILPFWMKLIDRNYGGFFGKVDGKLNIVEKADKGSILNSRILWTFSSAYLILHLRFSLVF